MEKILFACPPYERFQATALPGGAPETPGGLISPLLSEGPGWIDQRSLKSGHDALNSSSFGLWAGGRFSGRELLPYIVSQVSGSILAGAVLYLIASGQAGFDVTKGFAANGFGEASPGHYSMAAALAAELVLTAAFLFVIMGATEAKAPAGFGPWPLVRP